MNIIEKYFGVGFRSRDKRISSYNYLENFIKKSHINWLSSPITDDIVNSLVKELKQLSDAEFSFLLCHTGYIPENYLPDSSQETLYSKLVETIVQQWAIRIGFYQSTLPSQKSSKEDITICDSQHIIVCDAKSFRLGRSQGAPNVKDVLKHADIEKWLSAYEKHKRLGGLISFPSQHDWKKGSDFYQYTTDKYLPTISLYYEHMAFMLLVGIKKEQLVAAYKNYGNLFPNKIGKNQNNRDIYYNIIERNLFSDYMVLWNEYRIAAYKIISEMVYHCAHTLDQYIANIRENTEKKYAEEDNIEILRKKAIEAEFSRVADNLYKQKERIYNFRTVAEGYHEE